MRRLSTLVATVLAVTVAVADTDGACAYDPATEFAKGTVILSLQAGGGIQNNLEGHSRISNLHFVSFTPRLAILPLDPVGSGWFRGALETGLEGWVQHYVEPHDATALGLKAVGRYHFIGVGRLVPYVEVGTGVGGSSLKVREIDSTLNFVLEAGAGLSYFVAEGVALTAGYRFQHISNGNTTRPNRGLESDTGTVGVSFFLH